MHVCMCRYVPVCVFCEMIVKDTGVFIVRSCCVSAHSICGLYEDDKFKAQSSKGGNVRSFNKSRSKVR